MSYGFGVKAGWALAALGLTVLTGCGAPGEGGVMGVSDMLLLAGTTAPPPQKAPVEDIYCPTVGVAEGGAALQVYAGGRTGDASSLSRQIALGQLARECVSQPDGSTRVSVGVEARALLGVGGQPGRYDVPVNVIVKRGSTVIENRTSRVSLSIPAGQTQASAVVVESDIVVPAAYAESFEIEVGLGGRRG